jgi:hypothetical protein
VDSYGPPLLAYLLGHLLCGIAAYRHGFDWFSTGARIRWDGGIYLDIAHTGYYAAPCAQINPKVPEPGAFCGNAGWFPLFPFLALALSTATGLPLAVAGVLVAEVCALGMLILLWHLLGRMATPAALACLAIAAALPSGVYFHATYPMSLSVLLVLATFALLVRGRWVLAGLTGAAAATAYPLVVLLGPAAAAVLLIPPGRWSWRRLARAAYVGAMPVAGLLTVFAVLRVATGRFDAYLRVQARYGYGWHNPVAVLLSWLHRPQLAVDAEMLFSTVLVTLALGAVGYTAGHRAATALDWALAGVYGPLLLVAPLVLGANQAQFRSHTLLLPLVLPLRHLWPPVAAGLATVAVPLAVALAGLFLTRVLV